MTTTVTATVIVLVIAVILQSCAVNALGSESTIAVSYGSGTVCGIVADERSRRIECYKAGERVGVSPNLSYEGISGGRDFFCGLRSGGLSFWCWDPATSFQPKRVFKDSTVGLKGLTVGEDQVCGVAEGTKIARCWWRGNDSSVSMYSAPEREQFDVVTSGRGFSCGVLVEIRRVRCWGTRNSPAMEIEREFGNVPMVSLVAGVSHVCGLNVSGYVVCKGKNDYRQLEVPVTSGAFEFVGFALGERHSCGIRKMNGSVVCWGAKEYIGNGIEGVSFVSIAAGSNFTCGLRTENLSIVCWGPGWPGSGGSNSSMVIVPLPKIIPGKCTEGPCDECGIYLDSQSLCSGYGKICKPCFGNRTVPMSPPSPLPSPFPLSPPPPPPSSNKARYRGLLAFAIVGSVGTLAGFCTILYCIWTGNCCCNHKKIHNSVQPTITGVNGNTPQSGGGPFTPPFSRSATFRRQSSRAMRRQRSGTSSKHADRAEEFSLAELVAATDNFSSENKIGAGSFGTVYKGKLVDGREVAIKRGETGPKTKKFQEKESAFQSELAFLSRLHHKHLVALVGFCEEKDERLLVYEYMKNGALYDHLHSKENTEKSSNVLNSWKMRIKVALDAARGIEYLHNYAVPMIIHRDIKSSNILLDANWTARVSDFGLSLMGPGTDGGEWMPATAAGTVGYMDPEYYKLNVLTSKSDVYGLGVVLLELLTGRRAIFKDEEEGGGFPVSVVDYAVPKIVTGELGRVLDARVGAPEIKESEAVELVAYTAVHCVSLEGRERPSMTDIVANLERALALCDDSHGSISSVTFSIVSE